jgi:Txe/YoeB family toxin of Txe-Axe toxin-antitoxin module
MNKINRKSSNLIKNWIKRIPFKLIFNQEKLKYDQFFLHRQLMDAHHILQIFHWYISEKILYTD